MPPSAGLLSSRPSGRTTARPIGETTSATPVTPGPFSPMPFEDLVRRAVRGEPAAQSELFGSLYPRVRAIAHQQLEQRLGADAMGLLALFSTGDIVQEAFVAALRELPRFRGHDQGELIGWLAALVHNRVVDAIRHHVAHRRDRRRETNAGVDLAASSHDPSPSQAFVAKERAAAHARVLAGLAERDRELLHNRLVDELSWEAIATAQAFPSANAARFAFRRLQARLMLKLARAGLANTPPTEGA